MSVVNAVTIIADNLQSANITTSNVVTFTVVANQVTVTTGNITANSTVLKLDNTTSPIFNTAINTTAISTAAINLNSVQYTSIAPSSPAQPLVDYQVFTSPVADNKWYKPSWAEANDVVTITMWGGGGGGAAQGSGVGSGGAAGGGGSCVIVNKLAGECNAICNVVVGAGGPNGAFGANGTNGGNSIFWANSTFSITAYGGAGAFSNTTISGCGGGGGWFGIGNTSQTGGPGGTGGEPLGGVTLSVRDSTFGGGAPGNTTSTQGGNSVYGGGGGSSTGASATPGGSSIYGGGGGSITSAGGTSVFGGRGGTTTSGIGIVLATAPGGGGGGGGFTASTLGGGPSSGARGEVRITTTKSAIGGDTTPKYVLTANRSSVYESNTVTFTVTTFNVPDGTTLHYTLNNSSTATSADFSTAVNGSIVINGGANTFTLTPNDDTDGNETFYMDLRTGSSAGTIVANSQTIDIYPPATVTLTDTERSGSSQTSYTFTNQSLGTESSDRHIIVTIGAMNNQRTISSVTIAGITATQIGQIESDGGGTASSTSGIYMAAVPTGTTGTVVVTFSGSQAGCIIGVYAARNLKSTTPLSVETVGPDASIASASATLTTRVGGFIIATAATKDNGVTAWSWTNATENYDLFLRQPENDRATAGATATTSSDGSVTVTATPNQSPAQATFVAASFQ